MDIKISPIEEKDFKELVALFLEFATFEKLTERMINSEEKMLQEQEYIHGFVARNEKEKIVGYVTFFFAYYTWTGKSLYMDDLYVKEEYRGKGLGTNLINKVITQAKDEKCNKLRWQVSNWNKPAIEFYKNLGASIDSIEMNCDLIL